MNWLYSFIILLFCSIWLKSQSCKQAPEFINKLEFDISKSALISTDRRTRGVLLVEYKDISRPELGYTKKHQEPSWDDAGFVGSITLGPEGNAYVIPSAMVNTIHNPPDQQNTIYRIQSSTGKMTEFVRLPLTDIPGEVNAFGLVSSFLHCDSKSLIVSTIAGSNPQNERGKVYKVDLSTGAYKLILSNIDVLGVAIHSFMGKNYIVYGKAREGTIWMAPLDENFEINGTHKKILDLSNLGPRGDDRAVKISNNASGDLLIKGTPFYYNLTAPVEQQYSIYHVTHDQKEGWKLKETL